MKRVSGGRAGLGRLGYAMARDLYRHRVKRWLSKDALEAIAQWRLLQGQRSGKRRRRAGFGQVELAEGWP